MTKSYIKKVSFKLFLESWRSSGAVSQILVSVGRLPGDDALVDPALDACMDLDEMLCVDRCRDMDKLINFWARPGL